MVYLLKRTSEEMRGLVGYRDSIAIAQGACTRGTRLFWESVGVLLTNGIVEVLYYATESTSFSVMIG